MTFPFESLSAGSRELGLIAGVLIGVAFGFVLERAGFGRATKLAAQFYLRDMTVFKVMFTAIVTAMLGLVIASAFGFADLRAISESAVSWTYVWPMLAGGLLLGAGFIISGYCPGTSVVAAASGHIDGAFAVGGVITGTFIYSELLQNSAFHQFHNSGDKGAWFLYDLLPLSPALLAALIAVVAVLAFVGGEKVERWIASRTPRETEGVPRPRARRMAFAAVLAMAAISLATAPLPARAHRAALVRPQTIAASELARQVVAEPWKLRIADTRDAAAFGAARVPGAVNVQASDLDAFAAQAAAGQTVIVVDGGMTAVPAGAKVLEGGFGAWRQYALATPVPPAAGAPRAIVDDYLFRVALNQSLTGAKQSAAPVAIPTGAIAKPKKKGGGCSA